ncbi:MAG: UvrD-helicase domain-containing protein, partial [Dehalococcoidia bacterium]
MEPTTSPTWDHGLLEEQRAAASHVGSHARLLAGPGTGKTLTLTRRVVFLVTEKQIAPSDILALTFTRVAAYQLRTEVKRHLDPLGHDLPQISTLHSFALRQLLRNANLIDVLPQPLRIADDWEEESIIREDIKDLLSRKPGEVITASHDLSADWEKLQVEEPGWREAYLDQEFLGTWDEHRRIYGYTLRSELVYQLKRSLEQVPGFALESGFKHVLIDEYQDLNPCDLAITQRIAQLGVELMASGDDDQSIYGFRNADPSGIRDFLEHFPGAADRKLVECKRCGSQILASAIGVAEQDRDRVTKELVAAPGQPDGEVRLLSFGRENSEAAGIPQICASLISEGAAPSDMLILLRSDFRGVFSDPLKSQIEELGIPVVSRGSRQTVLDNPSGRRLLSLLHIMRNGEDHLAWRSRLQLTPGIGAETLKTIYASAHSKGWTFFQALNDAAQHPSSVGIRSSLVSKEFQKILDIIGPYKAQASEQEVT